MGIEDPVEPSHDLAGPHASPQDRSYLLGQVVSEASELEYHLRGLCSALVASKYGAVISAGQAASWLIDTSLALARAHDDIEDYAYEELRELMARCRDALRMRNLLVHGTWLYGPEGYLVSTSRLRNFEEGLHPISLDDIEDLATELRWCQHHIHEWIHEWLPGHEGNEVQLRWETYLRSLTPEEREELLARRKADELDRAD
ncbi:hypothetical protein ONA91_17820 [Micromonospora sp. DR5-3]|uniref:hypothetical protein n=1 Tax=unclassified Micromonospora TaxID=2617518 RepID=UPI0011D8D53E|nr:MULTISPECIES: hypothetical protein [unclassified Micromonospora]MCW3816305.1 hypothetical protein [Micromonospora sp. DR5-3]TYC23897.1 hypothetical protein FXF52_12670 [Micromonospora sp. MP36]